MNTSFNVEEYYGAKGVDSRSEELWENGRKNNDVFVITPQILLGAMRKAFLSLDTVCLMLFAECHLATGNHAYEKIMSLSQVCKQAKNIWNDYFPCYKESGKRLHHSTG